MKRGITAGGNFIIDHNKIIDCWPEQGMVSAILEEMSASGGCAYNVLKDLAILGTGIPLCGVGMISNDADGEFILEDLKNHSIDVSMMYGMDGVMTSYTDVYTVRDTGDRTFFHHGGANMHLDVEHFDFDKIKTDILHVGYILLLDRLDAPDDAYGTRMARLLKKAKDHGLHTSVDVVSESGNRFNKLVPPALRFTDYLILNEIEAGKTSGYEIREKDGGLNTDNLRRSLDVLFENGESGLVCIHFPEGAYGSLRSGSPVFYPSHDLPAGFIEATVGAGDAFCAGMLYGIHEEWDLERSMRFANAMAGICLSGKTTSDGMRTFEETLAFMEKTPYLPQLM